MRLTSTGHRPRWPHDISAAGFWVRRRSGSALPASPPKPGPRNERNPAEIHLSSAGNCSDNRGQLYLTPETGTGIQQDFTVYGDIPAGQIVPPDSYTDSITATVSY